MTQLVGASGMEMEIVASFTNEEYGTSATIVTGHRAGGFTVLFWDNDADALISCVGNHPAEAAAEALALELVANR